MLATLLIYSSAVYLLFYLLNYSSLGGPVRRHLPRRLAALTQCSLCWTWWVGVGLTLLGWVWHGVLVLDIMPLMAAPVVNLLVDLWVKERLAVAKPPPLPAAQWGTTASGSSGGIQVFVPSVWSNLGSTLSTTSSWTGWTSPTLPQYTGHLPYGWEMIKEEGDALYRPKCPKLVGRRVRIVGGSWAGMEGIIEDGYRDGDDCAGTWGDLCYRLRGEGDPVSAGSIKVPAKDCLLLDEPPAAAPTS